MIRFLDATARGSRLVMDDHHMVPVQGDAEFRRGDIHAKILGEVGFRSASQTHELSVSATGFNQDRAEIGPWHVDFDLTAGAACSPRACPHRRARPPWAMSCS